MALKDKWVDKVDGVDIASAEDINQVANAVIELENEVESGGGKGEDGFSPIVSVEKIDGGNRVAITDADGEKTFDVMDGANGQDGANGKDGAKGADGADGVSATHSWNGTVLTITSASGTSSADLKGEKGDKGDTGATGAAGADGNDYVLTETDKTEIAEEAASLVDTSGFVAKNQGAANVGKILVVGTDGNLTLTDMPEGGASGDVVGTLDESNNILLSGNLAVGTYTLSFVNNDGTYSGAGALEVSEIVKPSYTNLADPTSADWAVDSRFTSSGAATAVEGLGADITNYIPVTDGSVVRVKGMTPASTLSNGSGTRCACYKADKTLIGAFTSSNTQTFITVSGEITTINVNSAMKTALGASADIGFIRLNGTLTGTKNDVIITVDEEIV